MKIFTISMLIPNKNYIVNNIKDSVQRKLLRKISLKLKIGMLPFLYFLINQLKLLTSPVTR